MPKPLPQKLLQQRPAEQRGFTLIEVIAAILMLGFAVAATAPTLILSVATRIQARRLAQANALALREVDRVRGLFLRTRGVPADFENMGLLPPQSDEPTAGLGNTEPPMQMSDLVADRINLNDAQRALLVDVDGDGSDDYFIQSFRNEGVRLNAGGNVGQLGSFLMVVRVYGVAAIGNLGSLQTAPVNGRLTNTLDQGRLRPLAVVTSVVTQADASLNLQNLGVAICQLQTGGTPNNCP